MTTQMGVVQQTYQAAYPDAIVMRRGDVLALGVTDDEYPNWVWCTAPDGRSGWVPEQYIERAGARASARVDYDARELTIRAGERVTIHQEINGWLWISNESDEAGWAPKRNILPLPG
jgi:hypothetical protein